MRIAELNAVNFGSTGTIMHAIAEIAVQKGNIVMCFVPTSERNKSAKTKYDYFFGIEFFRRLSIKLSYFTGWHNWLYLTETWALVHKLKQLKPDVLHLHNLHGYYLNQGILFRYIKHNHVKVIWTLHDCWSFTGHCPHFDMVGCMRWKSACCECPLHLEYPSCSVDDSSRMFRLKQRYYEGVEDMTLVAPSKWMEGLLKESILSRFKVHQIYSGIDLNTFRQQDSDFRKLHNITAKYIVLGVAFDWGKRKGLDVFLELGNRLGADYKIVLVGVEENMKQSITERIIALGRTKSPDELAMIYSAATVFANPTREELFGLVNVEALACGTPVVTFKSGGSPESVNEDCGIVVEKDDVDGMLKAIVKVCEEHPFSAENCRRRAELFEREEKFEEYIKLYHAHE